MYVEYTKSGYIFMSPQNDCRKIVDVMLATDYNEEFCVADDYSPEFVIKLMEAGFLVMAMDYVFESGEEINVLLPKLHLVRSALLFENLRIKKSIRRYLKLYELKPDSDFEYILDRCVEKHGADWLTPGLVNCIKKIRELTAADNEKPAPFNGARPVSFALYREGKLTAGEFGIISGKVYTSYSGFHEESNAGTVQLILTTQYLQENGFSFFDLGMPMNYKTDLGATDISPYEFVMLFRGEILP